MTSLTLAVVVGACCCAPCYVPTPEDAERAAEFQAALRNWQPSQHKWTFAGVALSAVGMGLVLPGIAFTTAEAPGDARLGWGLLGFGLTALVAAVGMVIYNATL
jgi:hypothetical protein